MAFYCTTMLAIALELSRENGAYADIASKFFEHFAAIVQAANDSGARASGTRRTASTTITRGSTVESFPYASNPRSDSFRSSPQNPSTMTASGDCPTSSVVWSGS